jgi:hypothetical protein
LTIHRDYLGRELSIGLYRTLIALNSKFHREPFGFGEGEDCVERSFAVDFAENGMRK